MKTSPRTHEGRLALVTGAAQGIGQAIAMALAERGAHVIATDLQLPHETVNKIGPTAYGFRLDVSEEEDWRSVAAKSREVGKVDIIVNNAGYFPNRSIDELDLPTWRKTFATNLDAHFLSVKYFLPTMRKKKWGRFIGISSNMIGLAIPGMSHYIATKMGIIGFMRGLALIDGWPRDEEPSLAREVIEIVAPQLRVGGYLMNDNREPDFLEFIRDPGNGFISITPPLKSGTELSVKVA